MWVYANYRINAQQVGVGAAPKENIVVENGRQVVEPATAIQIVQHLANLCPSGEIPPPLDVPSHTGVFCWEAHPRAAAEEGGGGCGAGSALDYAQSIPSGAIVMVDFSAAMPSSTYVGICVATTDEAVMKLAAPGADFAVLNIDAAKAGVKKEEKKADGTTLLIGVVTGAGLGLAAVGPIGAVAGTVVGYFVADWLT